MTWTPMEMVTVGLLTISFIIWVCLIIHHCICFRNQDLYLSIESGTGAGQIRKVVSCKDSTITLETPWDIPPDNTSYFVIKEGNDAAKNNDTAG